VRYSSGLRLTEKPSGFRDDRYRARDPHTARLERNVRIVSKAFRTVVETAKEKMGERK
jgi:hypothetical protein